MNVVTPPVIARALLRHAERHEWWPGRSLRVAWSVYGEESIVQRVWCDAFGRPESDVMVIPGQWAWLQMSLDEFYRSLGDGHEFGYGLL